MTHFKSNGQKRLNRTPEATVCILQRLGIGTSLVKEEVKKKQTMQEICFLFLQQMLKMVNRNSSHYRASLTSRFLLRNPTSYAITLYIISLFAFSIFVFLFYTRNILVEDEQKPNFSEDFMSEQVCWCFQPFCLW